MGDHTMTFLRRTVALLATLAVSHGLYNYPFQTHPSTTPAIAGELAAPFNYRDSNRLSTGGVDAAVTLGGDSIYTDTTYLGLARQRHMSYDTDNRWKRGWHTGMPWYRS